MIFYTGIYPKKKIMGPTLLSELPWPVTRAPPLCLFHSRSGSHPRRRTSPIRRSRSRTRLTPPNPFQLGYPVGCFLNNVISVSDIDRTADTLRFRNRTDPARRIRSFLYLLWTPRAVLEIYLFYIGGDKIGTWDRTYGKFDWVEPEPIFSAVTLVIVHVAFTEVFTSHRL